MKRDDWWRNANSPAVCPVPFSGRCTPAETGTACAAGACVITSQRGTCDGRLAMALARRDSEDAVLFFVFLEVFL
jgi:hypothetical protein